MGDVAPLEVGDEPAADIERDGHAGVVVQGSIVHLAAEIDERDVVRRRRLMAERDAAGLALST